MLSHNEDDAAWAAEVRKNATFEVSFEHFRIFRLEVPSEGFVLWALACVSFRGLILGLILCGLKLETFPDSCICAQLGFLKKRERRSVSFALMNDEHLRP